MCAVVRTSVLACMVLVSVTCVFLAGCQQDLEMCQVLDTVTPVGEIVSHPTSKECLYVFGQKNSEGKLNNMQGAGYVTADGRSLTVWLGDDGLPSEFVIDGQILRFLNFTASGVFIAGNGPNGEDLPGEFIEIDPTLLQGVQQSAQEMLASKAQGDVLKWGWLKWGWFLTRFACCAAFGACSGTGIGSLTVICPYLTFSCCTSVLLEAISTLADENGWDGAADTVTLGGTVVSVVTGGGPVIPVVSTVINVLDQDTITLECRGCVGGETETIMLPGNVPLVMTWIPEGTFNMGRNLGEQDSANDEDPQHQVWLSHGFWLGKYEVTQAQWKALMSGANPSSFTGDHRPVERVSWNDIQAFIAALNSSTDKNFRLPTEAEWEYACRAGTNKRFYWGDDADYTAIKSYAWYGSNSDGQTHDVGSKLPNAWGLYDMAGNVLEWCQDWCHPNYLIAPTDGSAWEIPAGTVRVVRGGGWNSGTGGRADECRSANRDWRLPSKSDSFIGFRLAR